MRQGNGGLRALAVLGASAILVMTGCSGNNATSSKSVTVIGTWAGD